MTHLDFWPPEGRVYFVSETLKQPFCKEQGIKLECNLPSLVLGRSRRFFIMHLDLLPPGTLNHDRKMRALPGVLLVVLPFIDN